MESQPNNTLELLSKDRLNNALKYAAEGTSSSGENIFRELVAHIAKALEVKHAFIGELCHDEEDTVNMIASISAGQYDDDYRYSLEGTPCKHVVNQSYRFFAKDTRHLFPDPHVKELCRNSVIRFQGKRNWADGGYGQ